MNLGRWSTYLFHLMEISIRIPIILILLPVVCLTRNIQVQNGFYDSPEGLRCQMCPKGKFILQTCEQDGGASLCSVCPKGTFTSTVNSATECEECTPCRITMRKRSPCTDVSNTVCECPPGLFWVGYLGYDGICLHHTVCKEDEIVAVKGTANADTICKKAPPLRTLTSDTPTSATTDSASMANSLSTVPISTKESKVKDNIQPNSTKDVHYHVFIQGHRHTRPLKHHDIRKFSKPKNISTDFPVFQTTTEKVHNTTQISTESSEIQRFQKQLNESGVKEFIKESQTLNNSKENETHRTKVMANEISHVTVNQQKYHKPSTVAPRGVKRKRKRNKDKRKKLRRRRKKNRKDQKRRRRGNCRHKVEKKRKKCERRRKRMRQRKRLMDIINTENNGGARIQSLRDPKRTQVRIIMKNY